MRIEQADPADAGRTRMIAVNEALGYTVFGQPNTWFRLDVAAMSG